VITRQSQFWVFCGALFVVALAGCGGSAAGPEANPVEADKIRDKLLSAKVVTNASSESGGGAKTQPAAKKFDGWATLKGRFVVVGPAPTEAPIVATKDKAECGVHPLFNESVVVGKDNGLANVVVWVRTTRLPVHPDYAKSAAKQVVLDNHDCRFEPHVLGIRVGQTLLVKNSDTVAHNTKVDGESLQFNQLIPAGTSTEKSVDAAEKQPAPVACSIHEWMSGKIVVRPDPYFAISDKNGNFEIKNLPAGELEFQAWQEAGNLALDRPDLKWDSKGRFTITLEKDTERDLKDLSVPAATLQGH
jgi:plastocyanin